MKIATAFLFVGLFLMIFFSCKHDMPSYAEIDRLSPTVYFESDVLPLFQSYCAQSGCHDSRGADGYRLNNYSNIVSRGVRPGDANDSEIYEVLFETGDSKMPPSGSPSLSSEQKVLIRRWINQGAQNTTNCGTVCDPTAFKFSADIQPILNNFCVGCHGGSNPTFPDLSNYALVKNYIDGNPGNFENYINGSTGFTLMPKNGAKMSDCNINKIQAWINAGALNN